MSTKTKYISWAIDNSSKGLGWIHINMVYTYQSHDDLWKSSNRLLIQTFLQPKSTYTQPYAPTSSKKNNLLIKRHIFSQKNQICSVQIYLVPLAQFDAFQFFFLYKKLKEWKWYTVRLAKLQGKLPLWHRFGFVRPNFITSGKREGLFLIVLIRNYGPL